MSTIPTATNGGLLLYLAVALVLVFLAATYRPGRGIVLDAAHPHKSNPSTARILADEDGAGANPTPNNRKEKDMTKPTDHRLYRLHVEFPAESLIENRFGCVDVNPDYVPAAFTPTEKVPVFYWPKDDRIYKSRSAAQERAALLRRYGCTVTVLECTPVWESIPAANMRRRKDRLTKSIEKRFAGRGLTVRIVDHRGDEEGQR
jgi:hypothetical protein